MRASEDLDPAPLEAIAASEVVDGALALFERERSSGVGPVQTEVVLHATVTDQDPDRASVEDCVLLSPSFTETVGVWYEADLTRTGQGWIVDAVRIPSGGGCVPQQMADAAIAGYEAFYAGVDRLLGSGGPELSADRRGPVRPAEDPHRRSSSAIIRLAAWPSGVAHVLHPEVIEVRSPTELVILNCFEPASDYGVYDIDSGERLDDVASVRNGQRNLESAVMVLENDVWKVSDLQGQVDFACEFAPTDRGVPSV